MSSHLGNENSRQPRRRGRICAAQRQAFRAGASREDRHQSLAMPIQSRSPGRSRRVSKTMPIRAKTAFGIHIATPTGSFCCLARPLARNQSHPIDERQRHRHHEGARFAALARRNSERDSNQSEQKTGRRQRQALMQFDARLNHVVRIQCWIVIGDLIKRNGVEFGVGLGVHFVRLGGFQNLLACLAPTWCSNR